MVASLLSFQTKAAPKNSGDRPAFYFTSPTKGAPFETSPKQAGANTQVRAARTQGLQSRRLRAVDESMRLWAAQEPSLHTAWGSQLVLGYDLSTDGKRSSFHEGGYLEIMVSLATAN